MLYVSVVFSSLNVLLSIAHLTLLPPQLDPRVLFLHAIHSIFEVLNRMQLPGYGFFSSKFHQHGSILGENLVLL